MLIVGIIVVFILGYILVSWMAYNKIKNKHTKGFEKDVFGIYCKNLNNDTITITIDSWWPTYTTTNISVYDNKNDVGLLVWIPLYGGENEYGVLSIDDEAEESHQIYIDEKINAENEEGQKIINEKEEAINNLKEILKTECAIDFK